MTPENNNKSAGVTASSSDESFSDIIDPLLTTEEVALYLRLEPTTITKLARKEIIDGFKLGREWRFKKSKIQEFINKQTSA